MNGVLFWAATIGLLIGVIGYAIALGVSRARQQGTHS
jgi:hypothetical protein